VKSLADYIVCESKLDNNPGFEWLLNTYKSFKPSKSEISDSLSWMKTDMNICKLFEKFISNQDKEAWVYMANDDDFLNKDNYDSIINRLSDYLLNIQK
jgi:hypothetical protein